MAFFCQWHRCLKSSVKTEPALLSNHYCSLSWITLPVWPRETNYQATDLEAVIQDLLSGQYTTPIRVIAFNTAEQWSEDVSEDVAQELRRRCDLQMRDVPFYLQDFTDRQEGRYRDAQLPLPMRLV